MKPTVPETGTILKLEGDMATVILQGQPSCKGCGAGKIGLCRAGGGSMILTARNVAGGNPGDKVQIGIDKSVRRRGYLFAYLIPLLSFLGGALAGHIIGNYYPIGLLDVMAGFLALVIMTIYSFRRLRKLDMTHKLVITKTISDDVFRAEVKSDEERRFENYALKLNDSGPGKYMERLNAS